MVLLICVNAWTLEVADVQGRADRQSNSSGTWKPIGKAEIFGTNESVHLQRSAGLMLNEPSLGTIGIYGPAQARLDRLPGMDAGVPDISLTELQGLFQFDLKPTSQSNIHLQCGTMVLNSIRGKGRVLCAPDSAALLIWMDQGQVTAQHGSDYGITLESGRIWCLRWINGKQQESFVDSTWAQHFVRLWLGTPQASAKAKGQPNVLLQWDSTVATPQGTRWHLGDYLGSQLRSLSGLATQGDSLEWKLQAKVERFSILIGDGFWSVDVRIHCTLENQWTPFEGREFSFEKHWNIKDQDPNRLQLLQLLPLDPENTRIQASVFGTIAQEFRQFITTEALDPFERAGIELDANSASQK